MKDFLIAILILAVLIVIFSTTSPTDNLPLHGIIPKRTGESDIVVPGKGSEPANTFIVAASDDAEDNANDERSHENTNKTSDKSKKTDNIIKKLITKTLTVEEKEVMNEMLVVLWSGVFAVLIGQISVVAAILVSEKIRGKKKEVEKQEEE